MYDQYIAGFMVIGGFGDGINCVLLEISIWNRICWTYLKRNNPTFELAI